jgi:chorismate synthase
MNKIIYPLSIKGKPTSSISKTQQTMNFETGKVEELIVKGRHDVCVALRAPVILEAVTAIVFADLMLLEQNIKRVNQ